MKAGVGLLVVVAFGCKGDDESNNNRRDAAPDAPPSMAMIGPEGGTIASPDGIATLTIPPNAVAAATAFSIEIVDAAMVPAEITAATPHGAVYDIKPEGTAFATPATLTWTFSPPVTPTDAPCSLMFGYSYSDAGVIEPHEETAQPYDLCGFAATSKIAHLSKHFLTRKYNKTPGVWAEFGDVEIELGGGEHAVDTEWDAPLVALTVDDIFLDIITRAGRMGVQLPVTDVSPPEWFTDLQGGPGSYWHKRGSLSMGETLELTPKARFKCTAAGTGKAAMWVQVQLTEFNKPIVGSVEKLEDVICIERHEKPEYMAETAALGTGRIAMTAVPSTQMVDVTGQSGAYGYLVTLLPGQTIRVCVTSNGATNINYFPRYSPGFTFLDGAPGCTDITNLDTQNTNEVLIKLSGTGTDVDVNITTVP